MNQYKDVFIYHIFHRLDGRNLSKLRQVSTFFGGLISREIILGKVLDQINDIWVDLFGDKAVEFKKIIKDNGYIILWDICKGGNDGLDIEVVGYNINIWGDFGVDKESYYESEESEEWDDDGCEKIECNDNNDYDNGDYSDSYDELNVLGLNYFYGFIKYHGYRVISTEDKCNNKIFGFFERDNPSFHRIGAKWFPNNYVMDEYISKNQVLRFQNSYTICKETGKEGIIVPGLL